MPEMKILGIQTATIEVSFAKRIEKTLEFNRKNGYITIIYIYIYKEDTKSKKLSIYIQRKR